MPNLLLSLRKFTPHGTDPATSVIRMTRVQAICPISTRTAFFGSRRIAPAAEASWSQAWGARPAVESLRPAHRSSRKPQGNHQERASIHVSTFVTQVIAQYDPAEAPAGNPAASTSYEKADALDRYRGGWISRAI
jgi:hypothetical protein